MVFSLICPDESTRPLPGLEAPLQPRPLTTQGTTTSHSGERASMMGAAFRRMRCMFQHSQALEAYRDLLPRTRRLEDRAVTGMDGGAFHFQGHRREASTPRSS